MTASRLRRWVNGYTYSRAERSATRWNGFTWPCWRC